MSICICNDYTVMEAAIGTHWLAPGHATAAVREGWLLSPTDTSANGPLRVQRVDDPEGVRGAWHLPFPVPALAADSEAWALVRDGQQPHHHAARALLAQFNPLELGCIALGAAR